MRRPPEFDIKKPLVHVSALLLWLALSQAGCHLSLPPPTVQEFKAPQTLSRDILCATTPSRIQFTINDSSPLSGVLECGASQVTAVLFNSFNVRVRTITLSQLNIVRDENTYLSSSNEPADDLLAEIAHALRTHTPDRKNQVIVIGGVKD